MRTGVTVSCTALVTCWLAAGQSAPRFELASIKPFEGPPSAIFMFSSSGPKVTYHAFPIAGLIMEAYNLKNYQIAYAPSQPHPAGDYYYDVLAKAEGDAPRTRNEFRVMLQALLAERLNLKVHRETREMDVYALVVGRNGPKLKESAPDADPISYHAGNDRNQSINAAKYTMAQLADDIRSSLFTDRPVVDRTRLEGTYNIKLDATMDSRLRNGEPQPGDISIFDAVQNQLGLKLESQKAGIEFLVVDHVEKPSGN